MKSFVRNEWRDFKDSKMMGGKRESMAKFREFCVFGQSWF